MKVVRTAQIKTVVDAYARWTVIKQVQPADPAAIVEFDHHMFEVVVLLYRSQVDAFSLASMHTDQIEICRGRAGSVMISALGLKLARRDSRSVRNT